MKRKNRRTNRKNPAVSRDPSNNHLIKLLAIKTLFILFFPTSNQENTGALAAAGRHKTATVRYGQTS
jgi:hypothetical protein